MARYPAPSPALAGLVARLDVAADCLVATLAGAGAQTEAIEIGAGAAAL